MKAVLTREFLGSTDLLPLLLLGKKGIQQKSQAYSEDAGKEELSGEVVEYFEATAHLEASLSRIKKLIAVSLFPNLTLGLQSISSWLNTHGQSVSEFFKSLGSSIPREIKTALSFLTLFCKSLGWISSHLGIANLAFGVLIVTLGVKFFYAIVKITKALFILKNSLLITQAIQGFLACLAAFPAVTMVGVFLAITAAVTALVYALLKYRKNIAAAFSSTHEWLKKTIPGFEWLSETIEKAFTSVSRFFSLMAQPPNQIRMQRGIDLGATVIPSLNESLSSYFKKQSSTDFLTEILGRKRSESSSGSGALGSGLNSQKPEITIRFENLPQGARVSQRPGSRMINLDAGYSAGVFS